VGPRAGLDEMAKRKIRSRCRESNPDRPVRILIAILTELPDFLFSVFFLVSSVLSHPGVLLDTLNMT
jgi:hypothetical protein